MSPQALLRVKHRTLNTLAVEAKRVAKACFRHRTSSETEEILSVFAQKSGITLGTSVETKEKASS
jgi:phosphotransferase system enzyme I (PtsI)